MYDNELGQYLDSKGYSLSTDEYLYVCYTCPQINKVKYDAFSDYFEVWTDDKGYFRFEVFNKE